MAVFHGTDGRQFATGITKGTSEGTAVLSTDHAPQDTRKRIRWDFEWRTGQEGTPGCSSTTPCLNVVGRSYPTVAGIAGIVRSDQGANWEGAALGLDRWAVLSAGRAKSYPRDTRGDATAWNCKAQTLPTDDLNANKRLDEFELSKASERATPEMDAVREWELGGWKSGQVKNPYQAALTIFAGWENGRGGWDCEPLQRAFGSPTESWGSYFSYSLNDGWLLTG
jgi:hypothetical protein